jgi:hypothetical protein
LVSFAYSYHYVRVVAIFDQKYGVFSRNRFQTMLLCLGCHMYTIAAFLIKPKWISILKNVPLANITVQQLAVNFLSSFYLFFFWQELIYYKSSLWINRWSTISIYHNFSFTFSLNLNHLFYLFLKKFFHTFHLSMNPNHNNSWSNLMQNGVFPPFIPNQQNTSYIENSSNNPNQHPNSNIVAWLEINMVLIDIIIIIVMGVRSFLA